MAATIITPQAAADALGISLWDLAIVQGNWASEQIRYLDLSVTSNRASSLEEFDVLAGKARAHWAGALETMKAIEADD